MIARKMCRVSVDFVTNANGFHCGCVRVYMRHVCAHVNPAQRHLHTITAHDLVQLS